MCEKNDIRKNLILLFLVSFALRLMVLLILGPQWDPDSYGYMGVAKVVAETGQYATINPVTNQIVPFVIRPPFFQWIVAQLIKLFGLDVGWPVTLLNVLISTLIVILAAWLFYRIASPVVGLWTGYLMAFNPNSVYNSALFLSDTIFSFFCIITFILGFLALSKRSLILYIVLGLAIGAAAMIKPVFKYYWVITLILILVQTKNWRSWLKYGGATLLGVLLVIGPWLIRNQALFGVWDLNVQSGFASICSITDLVEPSTEAEKIKDPMLAKVRDVVVSSRMETRQNHPEMFKDTDIFAQFNYSIFAWQKVQDQLGLSVVETDKMLGKLAAESILRNPGIALHRFSLNTINFLNSPASLSEMVCRLVPGGRIYRQPLSVAWYERNWIVVLPTIITRIVYGLFLLLSIWGGYILWLKLGKHQAALLLVLSIAYFAAFSFVAGYDRYRLPVDPLLVGLAVISIHNKIKRKNECKNEEHPSRHYQP